MAIVFSGKSIKNRLTSSSTVEDFPEPPVPVIPKTGTLEVATKFSNGENKEQYLSCLFSAIEMKRAMVLIFLFFKLSIILFSLGIANECTGKSLFSTISLIIPCNPICLPSSGV